eukprot:1157685-Pelagomonas_calceolata.AAC.14
MQGLLDFTGGINGIGGCNLKEMPTCNCERELPSSVAPWQADLTLITGHGDDHRALWALRLSLGRVVITGHRDDHWAGTVTFIGHCGNYRAWRAARMLCQLANASTWSGCAEQVVVHNKKRWLACYVLELGEKGLALTKIGWKKPF